jgi:hypothetical protein
MPGNVTHITSVSISRQPAPSVQFFAQRNNASLPGIEGAR